MIEKVSLTSVSKKKVGKAVAGLLLQISVTVSSGLHTMFGSKEKKKENDNNVKPANAAEVVIQGETKEEIHI